MVIVGTTNLPGRSRARRLIPAAVVVAVLCPLGIMLVSAVERARNAARSADTT